MDVRVMFDREWKGKIISSFDEDREISLDELKQVLCFPFHPDTQLIVFELEGHFGDFGLKPFAMKDSYYFVDTDASNTPLYQTSFDEFSFGFSAYDYLDEVNQMSPDEIGELDNLAIDCLCEWFADLSQEVGGDSPIACMIQIHDTMGVYLLQERKWLTEEEFKDYFETKEN